MYLVTGGSGFIGRAIVRALLNADISVVAPLRSCAPPPLFNHHNLKWMQIGDIGDHTDWQTSISGVNIVIHCAARAHLSSDGSLDALNEFRKVNVAGTLNLARQAVRAGVQRFVFISSVGVNGYQSDKPFTEAADPRPHDAYSISKFEAEQGLLELASQSGMEVIIIRPPLVYGLGAPGNFSSLVRWVHRGLPLPLGAVFNRRSLLALDNLVSFVLLCADRASTPNACNQIFLVSDGEDVSTTTLLRKVAAAAGRPCRLFSVPTWVLRLGASIFGKRAIADRLLGNLQVDATKARSVLGWYPVVTMDQQLATMFTPPVFPPDAGLEKVVSFNRPLLRVLDVVLSATGLLLLWPVLLLICLAGWFDTRSPLFTQERVGCHQRPFVLVKFRTMRPGTAHVASHLANSASITRLGALLRRTKLDELPQLWNVLLGHMSLVGPRPGLYDQHELTKARAAYGIYAARPGITGLAQVNGIDMSTPELLAQTDARMLRELDHRDYFKFILLTMLGKGTGDAVKR